MVVLVPTGLVVLYLWLSGHWFGQALAFIAFAALALVIAVGFGDTLPLAFLVAFMGLLLAWVAASYPRMLKADRMAAAGPG